MSSRVTEKKIFRESNERQTFSRDLSKSARSLVDEFLGLLWRAVFTDSVSKRNWSFSPIFTFIFSFAKFPFPAPQLVRKFSWLWFRNRLQIGIRKNENTESRQPPSCQEEAAGQATRVTSKHPGDRKAPTVSRPDQCEIAVG